VSVRGACPAGETSATYAEYRLILRGVVVNPFEDEDGVYLVLVNDENQHSLWPAFSAVPAGWSVVHGAETRKSCLEYVSAHWTDMRPAGLIREMGANPRQRGRT
jgi:uncharacterized protein YbdZ (MbtH family)